MTKIKKTEKYICELPISNKTDSNLVVVIMGGTCAGKTTISRALHEAWNEGDTTCDLIRSRYSAFESIDSELKKPDIESDVRLAFTLYKNSAHIGILTHDTVCAGTDYLNSNTEVNASFNLAKQYRRLIVTDGLMTTHKWLSFMKSDKTVIVPILLEPKLLVTNYKRLVQRRALKAGTELKGVALANAIKELSNDTKMNIENKRNTFRKQYSRWSKECKGLGLQVATDKAIKENTSEIIDYIKQILDNDNTFSK